MSNNWRFISPSDYKRRGLGALPAPPRILGYYPQYLSNHKNFEILLFEWYKNCRQYLFNCLLPLSRVRSSTLSWYSLIRWQWCNYEEPCSFKIGASLSWNRLYTPALIWWLHALPCPRTWEVFFPDHQTRGCKGGTLKPPCIWTETVSIVRSLLGFNPCSQFCPKRGSEKTVAMVL